MNKKIISHIKALFLYSPKTPKSPFILEEPSNKRDNGGDNNSGKDYGNMNDGSGKYNDAPGEEDGGTDKKSAGKEKIGRNNKDSDKEDGNEGKHKGGERAYREKEESKTKSRTREIKKDKEAGTPGKKAVTQPIPINSKESMDKEGKESDKDADIHSSISNNLEYIKKRYTADINGDFKIRKFKIRIKDEVYEAFVCFFDGMIDKMDVNTSILQPLMTLSVLPMDTKEQPVKDVIYNHLIPQNQIKICKTYQEVVDEVNFGGIGIFVDGLDIAYSGDVKGWEHRNIEKPTSELNIRGPREAFNEINRMNTALLRKTLKDENLIVEDILVGIRSKTPCSMVYIKTIANDRLVDEIRRRLKSIKISYLRDSGELEQLIEDSTYLPAPQMLLTERPDRVTAYLGEGRVGIIVHGSPFAIIAPVTFFNLIHSPEDYYLRYPYATLLRLIRIMGILFTLFLPSLYLAITNFHQEMLPTDLLLAITSAREKVPFPTIISILIMEVSFELIREAGIRIPGPIGPTLGIIGALILGQAAVAANLVSPILIIIVAVTGIGSFAIPDFSFGYSLRALRFIYLLLASFAGLLGITLGVFIHLLLLVHAKSFGVPFLVPFAPKTTGKRTNTILKTPIWKEEDRPDFINPKDIKQQPVVSRGWVKAEKGVDKDETEDKNR